MLLQRAEKFASVSCGDTSTTVVVDLRSGFVLLLVEEDWNFDDDDWPPFRWNGGAGVSGYLPAQEASALQGMSDSDLEVYLYGLAHDTECEPTSWAELMEFRAVA